MLVYNYDEKTKEYLGFETAVADPEETKIQGKFVPLIPDNATKITPPVLTKNQTAIFTGSGWRVEADYRLTHKLCREDLSIEDIEKIGEVEDGIIVENELSELIKENPDRYKIEKNKIVEKTEEEYQKTLQAKENAQKSKEIKKQLEALDNSAIRALRAINSGLGTANDEAKLKETEKQAQILRIQLSELQI